MPLIGYRSHRLLFQNGLMYYSISETKIAAMNRLGQIERVYNLGQYELHHDYVFDDNGDMLILATDTESDSVEDMVVRLDLDTGAVDCVLDLGELFGDYKATCVEDSDGDLDWIHINTIQWLGSEEILLSSRETSTIIKVGNLYSSPEAEYLIGEADFWEGTGYEDLVLTKDESSGEFSGTGGQHSITYVEDSSLPEGQYYLYMFNNNMGISETRPDYDWTRIDGIETEVSDEGTSYYYRYLVDENAGTYTITDFFALPFSAYVSSVQEYGDGTVLADSGMQGIFGEYTRDGELIKQFSMELAGNFIYRVYRYDLTGFLQGNS